MNWYVGLIVALSGYLLGSVSFTRILLKYLAPGADLEAIQEQLPGTEEQFRSTSSGATAIMHQVSPRWGAVTGLLDVSITLVPVLLTRLLLPGTTYYMITAITAMLGHNYPIYYGFKGGRGLSTMFGGFLVFDWFGTLVTSILGIIFGVLSGQVVLIRWTGIILMIFWALIFHDGWQPVVYVILSNAIFWFAMREELKRFLELKRQDNLLDEKVVAEFMGMGRMYPLIQRYSLPSLLKKYRN